MACRLNRHRQQIRCGCGRTWPETLGISTLEVTALLPMHDPYTAYGNDQICSRANTEHAAGTHRIPEAFRAMRLRAYSPPFCVILIR